MNETFLSSPNIVLLRLDRLFGLDKTIVELILLLRNLDVPHLKQARPQSRHNVIPDVDFTPTTPPT